MRIAGTICPSRYLWCRTLLVISLVAAKMCAFSAARQGAGRRLLRCTAAEPGGACRRLRATPTKLALTPR